LLEFDFPECNTLAGEGGSSFGSVFPFTLFERRCRGYGSYVNHSAWLF